jgi:hypothetical protein
MWYNLSDKKYLENNTILINSAMDLLSQKFDPIIFQYLGYLLGLEQVEEKEEYKILFK